MKKLILIALSTLLAVGGSLTVFAADGRKITKAPTPDNSIKELTYPADTAIYRGVIEEFAVNDKGETVLLMRRATGSGYDANLKVAINKNTRFESKNVQYGNGSFLEVNYGGKADKNNMVTALNVKVLPSEDMVIFNGKFVSNTTDPDKKGSGQLLLDPIDANGMQFAFNYSDETGIYLDLTKLKKGDLVHVYHSAASTRSLPPQSFAFEISGYTAPEKSSASIPAATLTPATAAASKDTVPLTPITSR